MSALSFDKFLERIASGEPATLYLSEDRAEARPIRVRCAWCKQILVEGDPPESHGICEECAVKQGYADQADVQPETATEVAAAMERCRPAIEAAVFPGNVQDAVAAGVARSVGRAVVWIAGGLVLLVNAVAALVMAHDLVLAVMR